MKYSCAPLKVPGIHVYSYSATTVLANLHYSVMGRWVGEQIPGLVHK